MLKGKSALVTGSTSGIGLGIATALAEAGANVMLNGFGEASEIKRIRADLAERTGVQVLHSGADMSKPDQISDFNAVVNGALAKSRGMPSFKGELSEDDIGTVQAYLVKRAYDLRDEMQA